MFMGDASSTTVKEISNNSTIGVLICKRENKFVIKYCSDERIAVRKYEIA